MRIRITRTTVADGGIVRAGQVCDVSDADARTLILLGKAVAVDQAEAKEPKQVVEQPLTTESAAPIIEKKRGRPRRN